MGPFIPAGPGKPAAPVGPLSPGDPEHTPTYTVSLIYNVSSISISRAYWVYHTFQAPVALRPPEAPLRWAALADVEVALVIIQGVVLRANTRGVCALWVGVLKAVV